MASSTFNKAIILGNVGKDPEVKNTQDGKEIAILSVATSEAWRDKRTNEFKEKTEWHKVVVFIPGLIEVIKKYVKKGTKVYLEGSIQTRRWLDQSNVEKYTTEILLQSYNSVFIIIDSKNSSGEHGENDLAFRELHNPGKSSTFGDISDDDIVF